MARCPRKLNSPAFAGVRNQLSDSLYLPPLMPMLILLPASSRSHFSVHGTMNQTPETPPTPTRWTARRKRLLAAGIVALFLIVAIVFAALFYIRSGRLNR